MRIVAGRFKGHSLYVPNTSDTRPTMDRTRQAVFNILRSASWAQGDADKPLLHHAHILDVFAGSGAIGFEALSQGAASATFFEIHAAALQAIEKNRQKLKIVENTHIIKGDIQKLAVTGQSAQIAFFDPPYDQDLLAPALIKLAAKQFIDNKTLLVLETRKTEELPNLVNIIDTRIYGTSKITFARLV